MLLCVAAASLAPGVASAQEGEAKPPFYSGNPGAPDNDTAFFGSITNSNFYYLESAPQSPLPNAGATDNASPTERVFTELRLQLQADHISGGEVDFKSDIRGRFQLKRCTARANDLPCVPSQSGTAGGNEVDVREFYLRYRGPSYNIVAGRQFMHELAAIKFDGIRYQQTTDPKLQYFGFAGLYPSRGSRNVADDYPTVPSNPADPASATAKLLPVVAGAGATYNRGRLYGSVGGAAILPRGNERITALPPTSLAERPRYLVSSNGYWSQSEKTDIYHYLVLDVAGTAGAGVSNVSLGINHRPATGVNLFAQVNRVDTETLNVHAQNALEPVNDVAASSAALGNNWYVHRVAQESLRAGASSAFSQNRFQLTASGTLRRRPEIALRRNGDNAVAGVDEDLILPLAQALDITVSLVDRKSFERFRIGASVTRSAGFGDESLDRSESIFGTVTATRPLLKGKGEMELNLNYLQSADDTLGDLCPATTVIGNDLLCYGTSKNTTFGAGGLVFYRPDRNWYAMGMLSAARQTLTTADVMGATTAQPPIIMLTAFARLGYRF
jgi:hypothetical protein